jgi:hypothetical protein
MTHVYDIQRSTGNYKISANCCISVRLSWSSSSFSVSPPVYADTVLVRISYCIKLNASFMRLQFFKYAVMFRTLNTFLCWLKSNFASNNTVLTMIAIDTGRSCFESDGLIEL